jgi:hypothetical protein
MISFSSSKYVSEDARRKPPLFGKIELKHAWWHVRLRRRQPWKHALPLPTLQ